MLPAEVQRVAASAGAPAARDYRVRGTGAGSPGGVLRRIHSPRGGAPVPSYVNWYSS